MTGLAVLPGLGDRGVGPSGIRVPLHEGSVSFGTSLTLTTALCKISRFLVKERFGQKNGFRLCNCNSVFSRDLILKEVSKLNGIVWPSASLLGQFSSRFGRANGLSIFQFDAV